MARGRRITWSMSAIRTLGPTDRLKLSEYLDSIREVEQRIHNAEM